MFQELDNLFREHFGLDTNTCSGLSQSNKSTDTSSSDDDGEDEIDINQVVNQRVSQLLENDQDDIPDEENTEKNPDKEEDSNSFKCNCSNNCFENFNATEIRYHIYRLREMAKDEKEMFIMGSVKQIGSKKITSKRKER